MKEKIQITVRFKGWHKMYGVSIPMSLYEKLKANQGELSINDFVKEIIREYLIPFGYSINMAPRWSFCDYLSKNKKEAAPVIKAAIENYFKDKK